MECTGLTEFEIPKNIKKIGDDILHYTSLRSIKIFGPKEIGSIGYINSLTSITFGARIKRIGRNFFYSPSLIPSPKFKNLKVIYVPNKKTEYFKALIPEQYHSIIVELPAEKRRKKE